MKNDILNSALGGIDDDILRSAGDPLEKEPERPARKRRIKTWHIVAACHVIAAALAVTALIISLGGKNNGAVAESSSEETAVAFTKEAKLYFGGDEYARAEELTFEAGDIGGYLGEAEITEGESSAKAGLYAINGVSPEIAAAAKMPGGGYTIYFNSSYSAQTLGDLESGLSLNGGSVVPAERLDAEQLAAFIVSFERAQSATNRAGAEDIGEIINNYSVNVGALQGTVGFTTKDYVVANFFGKETAFKNDDEEEAAEDDILSQIFAKIESDKFARLDWEHDTEEFTAALIQAGLYHENTDDTRITNTTPQWLYDLYGAQIFWVHHRNRSYIWYNGEIYDIGGIGSMSGVSVIPCDFDNDGCVDLLTANLYGSGISGVEYGVFNMKTCEFHDVTRFMTLTRMAGCMVSKDGNYYISEQKYEENGWSAPRIIGQFVAYPSEPAGVRFVEYDKPFSEGLGFDARLDGFDLIDVVSYWNSLKESSGKDFFTLEEIYAECANLAKQNVAYDKNGPDSEKYQYDIALLGENVAENKDVLDLMLFTVENCFAEYAYSNETQLYGGISVISYAYEYGAYDGTPNEPGFDRTVIVCGGDGVIGIFSSSDLESGNYDNELSVIFAQKYPASPKSGEKQFEYTVHEDGTTCAVVSVSRFYPDPELVIPSEIDGYKVTEIASRAFRGQTGFTSVVIPQSVTVIGDYAFSGCMRLSSVTIPESVTYIGEAAFSHCALKSVNIPAGVTAMRSKLFWGCYGLKDFYYGGTAEQWAQMALEDTWDYAVSDYTVHCADGESVLYPQVFNSEMPEDFSFSIVWNTYGISSYDSQSGKLVKTNDATDVSRYTAYVTLSKEDLQAVYGYLLSDINITKYPASYDPFNAPDAQIRLRSEPNQTIIVTVTAYGWSKTVNCTAIAYGSMDDCYCEEAKAFLTSVRKVVELITSLPEWEAFPDYEVYYR